jgi:hypothetical protein
MPQQLGLFQFFSELLRTWRQILASRADYGNYNPADLDRVSGTLNAGLVCLPILRFLGLDPLRSLTGDPEFFHRLQAFCTNCKKQIECSAMVTSGPPMPSFDAYCPNAHPIREMVRAHA